MFTTAQVAQALGVKPRVIQRHILAGHLAATKYGRDYLITAEEVERFKRERRSPGNPNWSKRGDS